MRRLTKRLVRSEAGYMLPVARLLDAQLDDEVELTVLDRIVIVRTVGKRLSFAQVFDAIMTLLEPEFVPDWTIPTQKRHLQLLKVIADSGQLSSREAAEKLGISLNMANKAIDACLKLGVLERSARGVYQVSERVPSEVIDSIKRPA